MKRLLVGLALVVVLVLALIGLFVLALGIWPTPETFS